MTLKQEEKLDPEKTHFFVAHPHGFIGMSSLFAFVIKLI
jgi:hypothetical protein